MLAGELRDGGPTDIMPGCARMGGATTAASMISPKQAPMNILIQLSSINDCLRPVWSCL